MTTSTPIPPINLDEFRLDLNQLNLSGCSTPQLSRQKAKFIRGPIPLDWVFRAGQLKGKALQVAMILWFEAGFQKSRTVPLRQSLAQEFGYHRDTIIRAVRELEKVGLVTITSDPGKCLSVTLVEEGEKTTT